MKKSYIIIFIVSAIAIIACQKEDELTPSNNERFYFEVAADANDPTSVLRREFAEKTGSFLLFNDTLYKEQKGYSANGEPIWEIETVKMSYYITNDDSYRYTYDYIGCTVL